MVFSNLKTALALLLAGAIVSGGFVAQAQDAKKDDAKKEEPKKDDKKPQAKIKPRLEGPKKASEEFPELFGKLKKNEDEIVKIRAAMLKDIVDEESALAEKMKKLDEAYKGGDKTALKTKMELMSRKRHLDTTKLEIERRINVGEKPAALVSVEKRLGIHVEGLPDALVAQLGLEKDQAMLVDRVDANSPAAKAGLKVHDVLLKINGKAVPASKKDFTKTLSEIQGGTPFDVVVLRRGKQETITGVTLPATTTKN